ncbi:hypothetical protein [Virgibacillus sp. SK37]|uniref:hypothetical protein n=1 Tax=Virgibacillus sp. SK37 TaxID=403957 RepID=UPI0012EBB73D|nr:hypothetical protein [Virgibacillus sp. SK37]
MYNSQGKSYDSPDQEALGYRTSYISGEFQKYKFEIRAYKYTRDSLIDIDLLSSEAELLGILQEEELALETIPQREVYRLRKLEYNLRSTQDNDRSNQNIDYHLSKLCKEQT